MCPSRLLSLRLICRIALLLGFASSRVWSQPLAPSARFDSSRVLYRHWTVGTGLPQSTVSGIEQTPDGYLWIGTFDGLVRFDGAHFTVFNRTNTPALPSSRIYRLGQDSSGTLWIGTPNGFAARRLDGRWIDLPADYRRLIGNRPSDQLGSMVVARNGKVAAILPGSGLLLYDLERWRLLDAKDGLPPQTAVKTEIAFDGQGQLHYIGQYGLTRIGPDGPLVTIPWETTAPPATTSSLWIDPVTGRMIIGTFKLGALELRVNPSGRLAWAPLPELPISTSNDRILVLGKGSDGVLRLQTKQGLAEIHPDGHLTFDPGPEGAFRYNTAEQTQVDMGGSLWVGTGSTGLFQRQRPDFRILGPADGMPRNSIQAITEDHTGRMWFGTNGGGLARQRPDGRIEIFDYKPTGTAWSLWSARDGRLWIGDYGEGLFWLDPATDALHPQPLPESVSKIVFAIRDDPDGSLWVGTQDGLAHLSADGRPIRVYGERDGLGSSWVRCITRDRTGALWVATAAGAARLDGRTDRFRTFTTADGLGSNDVRNIVEDRGGQLWIGTYDGGIAGRVPGTDRFAAIRTAEGLADDGVFSILEDDHGNLWTGGNRGIQRLDRAELMAVVAGTKRLVSAAMYGPEEGLSNPETNGGFQPAGWRDRNGTLWFPTLIGAATLAPDGTARVRSAPPIYIEAARLDRIAVPILDQILHLQPSRKQLEIAYTAINLQAPNALRFRYRLDGVDDDWVEAGARRVAFYTNLPAGTYTFRVQATGGGTPWSAAEARLTVVREPFFYERWLFRLLLAALILATMYLFMQLRLRRLSRRAVELEQTVSSRTSDLAAAKGEAERALVEVEAARRTVAGQADALLELDRAKSRFFVNLSHEFRTPLTLIVGPLEAALDGSYGALPTPMRGQSEVMLRHSRRLLRLVNQMLDLARLEAGRLLIAARPVDLVAFSRQVGSMFSAVAGRQGLTLVIDLPEAPVVALADEDKLEQIVSNLLSNAVKFTPTDGKIVLKLAVEPSDGAEWRIRWTVTDTGIGIPTNHLTRVFDRFHQVDDSATRSSEGSGIGLALVKELVKLMGGEITVESRSGSGTTFTVQLTLPQAESVEPDAVESILDPVVEPHVVATPNGAPAPDESPSERAATPTAVASADAPLVLVVEDNDDLRRFVVEHLRTIARTAEAGNGADGLRLAREIVPDLILSDVMMPGMDGLALCRTIKTDPVLDHIPVALLTARVDSEHRIEGLEHGADAYLGKPFRPAELRATILGLIETRRRLQARYHRPVVEAEPVGTVLTAPAADESAPLLAAADERFMTTLRERLDAHLDNADYNVDDLIREMGMSRMQLYRKLKAITGETPAELLRRLRLDRAAELLQAGELTVGEIAYAVGFSSPSYFARAFRERFGRTPTEHATR